MTMLFKRLVLRLAALALFLLSAPVCAKEPIGPMPLGEPGNWVTSDDYPRMALTDNKQGVVHFALEVDPTGKPVECKVEQSSGDDELDITACSLITQRARFAPARNEKGRAVAGRYINSVKWVLPKTLSPPQAGALVLTLLFTADGSIAECKVVRAEGTAAEVIAQGKEPCEQKFFYEPYRDASGYPAARRVTVTTEVKVEVP